MLQDAEFWVAIALVIVVAAGVWKGLKPFLDKLDKRSEAIRKELDEARGLREEAQAMLADYKRKQRDAIAEAEQIVDHAKQEAERVRKKAEAHLEEQLERRQQQALDKIAQAEKSALRDVRIQAVDLAIAATAKLVERNLSDAQAKKLVDQTLSELGSKLN
jgi:F-type H+-transporting ATPase subunit b